MLINNDFIVDSHNKYTNIYVSLLKFISVVFNSTILSYQLIRKIIDSKRIPSKWNPFFLPKNLGLLTINI